MSLVSDYWNIKNGQEMREKILNLRGSCQRWMFPQSLRMKAECVRTVARAGLIVDESTPSMAVSYHAPPLQ